MCNRAVSILLLFSLFTNVVHAAIIYSFKSCEHETVCEYVLEMEQVNDCGDLCEKHHMFHLSAIPASFAMYIPSLAKRDVIDYLNKDYLPPLNDRTYRPPIS
ncbi:hypothetical protein NNO_0617 [Hydrogenimonas sp.]|nr:hypothetical protein NNO_0617 [Hydrogenimonas sp.]